MGDSFRPHIALDGTSGELLIEGRSMPENALDLYEPVLGWVKDYLQSPAPRTRLSLRMQYYNTSSSKMLIKLLQLLDQHFKQGGDVLVDWYYELDDFEMEESGYDLSTYFQLPFSIHPVEI